MKFVTDCVYNQKNASCVFSTYEYCEGRRKGEIITEESGRRKNIPTSGTFDISLHQNTIVGSNSDGVSLYEKESLETKLYLDIGISYKHDVFRNTLVSASASGTFFEVDLGKEVHKKKKVSCKHQTCISDIWSVCINERSIYLGCDMGTLSIIDRRSEETKEIYLSGGITWISKKEKEKIEVGTYLGEYCTVEKENITSKKTLPGIIWRIHKIEIEKETYNILSQSYDGIGIYTSTMDLIKKIETNDLVYSIKIQGEEKETLITGYNYYTGEIIEVEVHKHIKEYRERRKMVCVVE